MEPTAGTVLLLNGINGGVMLAIIAENRNPSTPQKRGAAPIKAFTSKVAVDILFFIAIN
jgi:hypothetical protein